MPCLQTLPGSLGRHREPQGQKAGFSVQSLYSLGEEGSMFFLWP